MTDWIIPCKELPRMTWEVRGRAMAPVNLPAQGRSQEEVLFSKVRVESDLCLFPGVLGTLIPAYPRRNCHAS